MPNPSGPPPGFFGFAFSTKRPPARLSPGVLKTPPVMWGFCRSMGPRTLLKSRPRAQTGKPFGPKQPAQGAEGVAGMGPARGGGGGGGGGGKKKEKKQKSWPEGGGSSSRGRAGIRKLEAGAAAAGRLPEPTSAHRLEKWPQRIEPLRRPLPVPLRMWLNQQRTALRLACWLKARQPALPVSWLPPIRLSGQPSKAGRAASFWRSSAVRARRRGSGLPGPPPPGGRQWWGRSRRALRVRPIAVDGQGIACSG